MSRARLGFVLVLFFLGLLVFTWGGSVPAAAGGNPRLAPHVPGEILLRFQPNARALDRASAQAQLNASKVGTFHSGAEHWRLGSGLSVEQALERLGRNPHVEYAEPNYILTADLVPNDPRLNELYGMINTGQTGGTNDADIDADQAWSIARGSRDVIVAVIDTGVDDNHPDLAANMWSNPGETPGDGIDNDGNGFIDDIHGWDFVNNDGNPFDDNGHGTHCAGTIGAVGNNGIGVVGVNWEVSIMALKFLSSGGSGSTDNAVRAVQYATLMGATLSSNSWGGGGFSQTLYNAVAAAGAQEIAFIAAAGNNGTNNDTSPHYPSNYDLANVISVAATDHNDNVASFSNWGATTVDIAAPGVNILSTEPGNQYQLLSGTSMATPHVAGAAALLKSRFPNLPVAQLKFALMSFSDQKPVLHPVTGTRPVASGGRLNVFFSIADPDEVAPGAVSDLAAPETGSNHARLTWTATGDDGATGTASSYQVRYSTSPIDDDNFASATRVGNEPNPAPAGSPEQMEVRGLAADTQYYFALKAFDEWGNAGPLSNIAAGMTLPPPTAGHSPASITEDLFTGETADHIVTLRNDGVGTLDFAIPTPEVGTPLAIHPALPLEKDEPDPREGILGSGGPDTSGYRWKDSDDPGGPGFNWVEIAGTGTPITGLDGDDEIVNDIPIGFPFNFYGNTFSTVNVSTNGWLSFTNRTASGAITYSNQPLPTSGGPENLVAAFWDDLNFRGAVHAWYLNDGSRFIVQWQDVDRHPAEPPDPDHLTFQIILYPDGRIVTQYLDTNGRLDSTTVGIQNGTRTDGLTVAFNAAYLHDDLAVEFSRVPQWLTATPASGRIPAGGSVPVNVHLDAAGLEGGTYPGAVHILTNDPNNVNVTVPVTLNVTGAPDAAVSPAAIDFGDVFLGLPFQRTLNVFNAGTDTLHVSDVSASGTGLGAAPTAFDLAPHFGQDVTVTLTGAALGPFSGSVTVHSDDSGEPAIVVPVSANVIPAPVVVVSPTSFTDTLFSGNTSTHILTVSNTGGSNLVVTAAADQGNGDLTSTDPSIAGQGGPDAFGYKWRDSDAPGGPAFNFVDISSSGTAITFSSLDDSVSAVIPMGMTFPFYGANFSSLKVSTNGWITFDPNTTASTASNGTMPSTSLARSAIAAFWDDLHLRVAGRVRYQNDGTRFIVQWTNVDRFSTSELPSPANLTFQIQLYPNGRVLIMYRTMVGRLNSATIGIQNQARNTALQVISQTGTGTPYVHDNLALQFSRTPDWLSVSPAGDTVPPGESRDFNVTFDATDRTGGTLLGAIVLGTNVPGEESIQLPATLNVIGAPNARVAPASIGYGTVFTGYPQVRTFQVFNDGTDVLNVSDVAANDPSLSVEDLPGPTAGFTLAPGSSRVLNLRWLPASAGPLNAAVIVTSDDPDSPSLGMPVTGSAIDPPVASHTPAEFNEAANVGDVLDRTLRLENHGASDLTYSVSLRAAGGLPVPVYEEVKLDKGEEDPQPGILGGGGPDLFGYRWKDSNEPGGPSFAWEDISGTGTPIATLTGDDQTANGIPIGFSFPFYGNTFNTVNVKTNGFLSFTSTATTTGNLALPNTGAPENLLAPYWDDLHFRGTVRAHYRNDGSRFIVQYTDVDRFSTTEQPSPAHLTFQVILYPNGRIVYQYLTMSGFLTSATIGIQNGTKNDGLLVVHNAAYMQNSLAIEIRPPVDFISVNPTSGTIPAGGSADLGVRMDASTLIGGDYSASIELLTNDPANGLIGVPVRLHVTGTPDVDVTPAAVAFPTTFVGFGSQLPVAVKNVGTDVLHVSGISASGAFTVNAPALPVALPVNGTIPLMVTFTPPAEGMYAGSLTVDSSDPDEASVVIPLSGDALIPPEVDAAPDSISTALPPGGARTKSVTLSNNGGSDLIWTTGTNIISAVQPGTYVELGKDEQDNRIGILGSGGPDMFGYRWTDSDDPGGPLFDWTDITGTGTPIAGLDGDDEISLNIPLGMSFPYYGNTYNKVNVHTNGYLTFTNTTSSGSGTYTNQPLPNSSTSVAENMLAVFWDDLDFRSTVRAYYLNDGSRFIIQWNDVDRHPAEAPDPDHLTFQAILYPNGHIVFQYLTMNGKLDSATIGQQNASRDDGLTVAFNTAYVHDSMAIRISPLPQWITVSPTGGTIPAGGSQELTVLLNAAGLEDGLHESTIDVSSNDPYTPLIHVPVTLNVGVLPTAYLNFDPDVLNLSANGNTVKLVIELPAGYDPHAVNLSNMTLNDTIPALPSPVEYTDENGNGIEEIVVRFDRAEVEALLPEGSSASLTVQFEVTDVQWFRGTTTARMLRPHVQGPNGGEYLLAGQSVDITWSAPNSQANVRYNVYLTRDGGATWELLASDLAATGMTWTVEGAGTAQARVRVVALDNQGVMGYDTSDGVFTLAASSSLLPPHDIGDTLEASADATDLILVWKRPAADALHGPVDRYRVLRASAANGPFNEVAVTTTEIFREPVGGIAGEIVYYKVIAANAGGDASN